MEEFKEIEFHKARDFSNKVNATFEFIKQNFAALGKSILFIAGPPVMIASLLMGNFISEFMNLAQGMGRSSGNPEMMENYFLSVSFWIQIAAAFIFLLVSGVVTIATINNYLILYGERKTSKIEVNEVWDRVRETFWMYFGTTFFFALLAVGAYLVLLVPIVILGNISGVLIVLGVLFFIIAVIYLSIAVSLTFFIRGYEKKGFFESVVRSYNLVRGKWWSTFGLIIVLSLIVSTISYIFIIPWYIMTVVSALHNTSVSDFQGPSSSTQVWTLLFFTLYYLAQMILYALPNVGIAFQYFNLVELKEARGLLSKIDSIGKVNPPTTRPEENY